MGLMGLVVDVVEVLGAIISNSSYGDRTGNCSLEIGASISATSANVSNATYRITNIIPGTGATMQRLLLLALRLHEVCWSQRLMKMCVTCHRKGTYYPVHIVTRRLGTVANSA